MKSSLFQSRFSRRLMLLFVGCALAPVGALAGLVFTHTADQLERQSQARLHQGSKSVGLAILERLSLLEEEARLAGERFERAGEASVSDDARAHFDALAWVESGGAVTSIVGDPPPPPALDPDQEAHLARGRAVLVAPSGDEPILLVVPLGAERPRRILAALSLSHLVVPAALQTDGAGSEYCLLPADGGAIACSFAVADGTLAALREPGSGALDFDHGGEGYLAHRWSLFLKARFAAPPWDVVLAEPRRVVMEPLAAFQRSVALVVVGAMIAIMLLSSAQIRRSLVPLRRLRAGARRIAGSDFETRVQVDSRDEFQEVADAFNGMAETLGRQFKALVTIDEIDRAVLSSLESMHIVETVLAGIGDVQRCDAVGFVLLDVDAPERGTLRFGTGNSEPVGTGVPVRLEPSEIDALQSAERVLTLEASTKVPAYLDPLVEIGMGLFQVLPVRVEGRPRAAVVIAHADAPSIVVPDPVYARQIADQVAVALANADMIAEIRELNRTLEDKVRERTAELSAAMEELRETQARLVHREKMASVGQLVAGVAHEINNPLNFIQGNIKFLDDHREALAAAVADYESALAAVSSEHAEAAARLREQHDLDFVVEDLASIVEACREGVERTSAIVADLQSFSRMDGGDARPADLGELIDSTLSILGSRLTAIEVVREYGDVPPVECLAGQISQVLMNLIVNAADAIGESESGRITIRTLAPDADTVRFEVEDDGCGVPEDLQDRIFDPFFTTKQVGQGTGLGLAITFGVVSRHGGRIQLESEPGRGACFRVDLPVKFLPPSTEECMEAVAFPGGSG
jgi:signal transduction histidine kinase